MKEIKDAFMEAVKKAAITLINQTVNATSLGLVILVWLILSGLSSLANYKMNNCDQPKLVVGQYLHSRLFCRVNQVVD